jgi:hypothetical protein
MHDQRLEVSVTFDERRGYVASGPKLRQPVVALSLGGLRRRIEIAMLPDDVRVVLQLDSIPHGTRALIGHAWGSGLESKGRGLCHQPTAIMGCRLASYLRMTPQDAPKRRRECWRHPCELVALVQPAPRRSACGDIAAQDRSARSRAAGHSVEYSVDGSASWQSESQSSSSLSLRDGLDMSGVKEVPAGEAGLGNRDFKINTLGCLAVKTSRMGCTHFVLRKAAKD